MNSRYLSGPYLITQLGKELPLLYVADIDAYAVGKSDLPFNVPEDLEDDVDVNFDLEDDYSLWHIHKIRVVNITRRHVYFIVVDDEESESDEVSSQEGYEEESLLESSEYPEGDDD